jgi:hypothetical protein
MKPQTATKLFMILFLGSAALYLLGGVVTLAWSMWAHRPPPNPPPTLVGVSPAPLVATLPVSKHTPHLGSFGVPKEWKSSHDGDLENAERDHVTISNHPLPGGVRLATAEDRKRAVALEVRIRHAKVEQPVELTVSGRDVIEVAGIDESEAWTLHVFAFSERAYSHVTCRAFRLTGLRSSEARTPLWNWQSVLPGCAAVAASVKVMAP